MYHLVRGSFSNVFSTLKCKSFCYFLHRSDELCACDPVKSWMLWKCFQWMGLGAASSKVCFDTICDIEEFPCLSPPAYFSAMTELHHSNDGVTMTESPQKCKVNGKVRLWCLWWFGLSVFPLQLVVSQWFRFQALCHRAVLVRY